MAWKDAAARHRRAEVRNLRKIFLHFPQKIYGLDASATVTFNQLSVLSATRRFRHFELSKATADPSSLRSAGMTVCGGGAAISVWYEVVGRIVATRK